MIGGNNVRSLRGIAPGADADTLVLVPRAVRRTWRASTSTARAAGNRRTAAEVIWLLWAVAIATFAGWHFVDTHFGIVRAQNYFYVMQGVLMALLALYATLERKPQHFLFLAIYVAAESSLVAACGVAWYYFTPHVGAPAAAAMCDRDHGWVWIVIVLCAAILWGLRHGSHDQDRH